MQKMLKKWNPQKSCIFDASSDFSDVARTIFVDFPRFRVLKMVPEATFEGGFPAIHFRHDFCMFFAGKTENKKTQILEN